MYKLNITNILHTDAIISTENIYDDSIEWRLDTSCDWCPRYKTCPYSNIDRLNAKRSCFICMSDIHGGWFKVYLLKNNVMSSNRICCFYNGRCYDK